MARIDWKTSHRRLRRLLLALLVAALASFALLVPNSFASPELRAIDAPVLGDSPLELPELPRGFDTRNADWIHISYPTSLSHWVEPLLREANEFRALARSSLGQSVLHDVRVRLATDPTEMAALAPVNAPYPKYAVGVAYSSRGLILLTLEPVHPSGDHKLSEVLRHELAHVALHEAVRGEHVPLWFNEGLAIHLARENSFARMRTLWTAAVSGNLIELRDLDQRFPRDVVGVPLAYAQSADIVRYLLRQQDSERFELLIQRIRRGQGFDRALYDAYGMDLYNLERNWLAEVDSRYSLWPILLSGSLIWGGATLLIAIAWRRKRAKQRRVMQRWAKEEATEDARLAKLAAFEAAEAKRAAQASSESREDAAALVALDPIVPKVRHGDDWHTLH